ncbi:RimK family alpha-L-glutamate ligase [Candidatus Woesearchaeota archaeon]|nr:RimK family alpha-L-glutamate ligase [Candidatus Woesearchaeota archaeon]
MNAAVVSLGSDSSKWTIDAMKKYFDEVDDIDIRHLEINFSGKKAQILYKGEPLKSYDCLFAKGSFRYANLLQSLTVLLDGVTYLPLEDKAFVVAHDKLLTQLELQRNNIPMPTTHLASTIAAAREMLERLNYPIIMKFPQGTQGKGVLFADSFASASSILDALSTLRQPFIIQEYVETGGTDVRAFVVGDKVVAAYKRVANKREVRSNIHAGGVGEAIDLDEESRRVAIKASKAIGAPICGVDLLISKIKGPLVIELNVSPGLQGITQYTGIDVADKIALFLHEQTSKKRGKELKRGAEDFMMENLERVDVEINTLITNLDFRGNRVLLPEVVSKVAGLNDGDYEFKFKKGEIVLKKFDLS